MNVIKKRVGWYFGCLFYLSSILISSASCSKGDQHMLQAKDINLPETINGWKLEGPPKQIDKSNIFDYMDGGGELYLSYKFDHLLVYQYADKSENEILVEIYQMKTKDEAFGLLSLDWTGEPMVLNPEVPVEPETVVAPASQALYGEGLLRAGVNNLYLRILASKETSGVREAILKLTKIMADKTSRSPLPDIFKVIKVSADSLWKIRRNRTAYFHSHLILNSLFYLSHENILNLTHSAEAAFFIFEKIEGALKYSAKLLVIKYSGTARAEAAFRSFNRTYLPETTERIEKDPGLDNEKTGSIQIEDGCLGWKLRANFLALVFQCPDLEAVREILNQVDFR